jgi:WD40 repeat protein
MLLRYSNGWSYSIQEIRLEFQDTFVVTSSRFVKYSSRLLILGSRRGELTVWDLSESLKRPRGGTIFRLHNDAITSIMVVASGYQACAIGQLIFATTGRDGTYKVHSLTVAQKEDHEDFGIFEVQTTNDCKPPFGPYIEGAYLDPLTQHMYIWGFRSTEFIVWDDSMKAEVLSIECGNAHRRWDYVVHEDGRSGGSFIFTKASLCCTYFQNGASHCVIQSGSHGREAKALALSPLLQTEVDLRYLATGAEDTAIRIFEHMPADENPTLHCVSVLTNHTTGIQQLRWSADGRRLFSAAGCEEFFVWRITKLRSIAFGVVCEARCPTVTEQSDLRILDFDIRKQSAAPGTTSDSENYAVLLTMVYSDSSMRVYEYSPWLADKFNLVFTGSYNTRCLTQIGDLRPEFHGDLHVCTASTDGSLVLWRLDTRKVPKSAIPVDSESQLWNMLHEGHKGSIKSLKVLCLSILESVVVTGGDDGDIRLTHLQFCDPGVPYPTSVFILPRPAHAAAVTSVDCLGTADMGEGDILLLASVSTDQCLKVWIVKLDKGAHIGEAKNAITCKKYTNVADPSSLGHFKDSEERLWLFVVGIGVEVWRVNLEVLGISTKSFCVR